MNESDKTISTLACGCRDFSRSERLRASMAGPGQGLPAIEGGMPTPAGTGLTRRSFINRASGLALAVYGASALAPQAFEEGIAEAQAQGPGRILVAVFLSGGIDALTVLAPIGDPAYATLRPNLKVATSADPLDKFTQDARLQWHPNAAPIRNLHRAGKVSVVPAIGYTDPNQSHFTSRHYWEVGEVNPFGRVGWLGRYLDAYGTATNPLQGLSLEGSLAPSLAPTRVPVAAVGSPENYTVTARDVNDAAIRNGVPEGLRAVGSLGTGDEELNAAREAARFTIGVKDGLAPLQGRALPYQTAVPYPASGDGFPRRLQSLAEMIALGLPLKCVAINANGGYDTHDNQAVSLPNNLTLFSQSLAAFQADIEARGVADRVLTMVWSEFGRRPKENGTGTDHGAAGLGLIVGTRARGAMIGEFPGLAQLDNRSNLRHTADFRQIYTGLVEQWLGGDGNAVIPGGGAFPRPALVK